MTNENTEIVVALQKMDLKAEVKKQLKIAVTLSLQCTKKPAKDWWTMLLIIFSIILLIGWTANSLRSEYKINDLFILRSCGRRSALAECFFYI